MLISAFEHSEVSMSKVETLAIRFIRKSDKTFQTQDDVLSIKPQWQQSNDEVQTKMYEVKMTYAPETTAAAKKYSTTSMLSGYDIMFYLRSVLNLITYDADPYKLVQIDLPMMPSVMIELDDLADVMGHIEQMVEVLMRSWPTIVSQTKAAPTNNSTTGFPLAYTTPPSISRIWETPLPPPRHIIFDTDDENGRDLSVLDHP
jgi:hypothetical protein